MTFNNPFMKRALELAQIAFDREEVPIGAVIVDSSNTIIAEYYNISKASFNFLDHAEILVLNQAAKNLNSPYLDNCDLYVTLEPCAMCAGAISLARIRRLYYGAYDIKGGAVDHGCRVFDYSLHTPEVISGIQEQACGEILKKFFEMKR